MGSRTGPALCGTQQTFACAGNQNWVHGRAACSKVTILTELLSWCVKLPQTVVNFSELSQSKTSVTDGNKSK